MSFFSELRRRNVFKVATAYAIVAWLLVQVAATFFPALQLPAWTVTFVAGLVIIGFPIALLMAWAYEMKPGGIAPAADANADASSGRMAGQRLNYMILGLVVLAVGFLVFDRYGVVPGAMVQGSIAATTSSTHAEDVNAALRTNSTSSVVRASINIESTGPVGDTGLGAHVTLSADGRRLVYAVTVGDEAQLYVRDLDDFEARAIPGTVGARQPFLSPDGEWVGFYTDDTDQKLKIASVRGGATRALADALLSGGGSWLDNQTILFGANDADSGRALFSVSMEGGEPELRLPSNLEEGYVTPDVLPDGDSVLVAIRRGSGGGGNAREGAVGLLSLSTGEVRTLIERAYRPQYAATGHIVFVRGEALWAVPFDAETLETQGPEAPVLQGVQTDGFRGQVPYALSDNGTLVYVSGGDTTLNANRGGGGSGISWQFVWVDRDGNEEPLPIVPLPYLDPALSPDGTRLAVTLAAGENEDIYILDLAGDKPPSRLTFDAAIEASPLWTPDGQRIVYTWEREDGGMFERAADGSGQPRQLTHADPGVSQVPRSFSADGSLLSYIYVINNATGDVGVLSLGDEPASDRVLRTPINERFPVLSPNGRFLAYGTLEPGQWRIEVRTFPDLEAGRWQPSTDSAYEARWNPSGDELFYLSDRALTAVPVDTESERFSYGKPRILFDGDYLTGNTRLPFAVSPDGQRFLMPKVIRSAGAASPTAANSTKEIRVVTNWFEELRRLAPPSQEVEQ